MVGDGTGSGDPGVERGAPLDRRQVLRASVAAATTALWVPPLVQAVGMREALAQGASPTPPPATCASLTGEHLRHDAIRAGLGVSITCAAAGENATIQYSIGCGSQGNDFGTATGPYPGSFCETGTATIGPEDPATGQGELLAFFGHFSIRQLLYDPRVTPRGPIISISGTKTFVAGTSSGQGTCSRPSFPQILVFATDLVYTATIAFPDGTLCQDEGTSDVSFFSDGQGAGGFGEEYTSTRDAG